MNKNWNIICFKKWFQLLCTAISIGIRNGVEKTKNPHAQWASETRNIHPYMQLHIEENQVELIYSFYSNNKVTRFCIRLNASAGHFNRRSLMCHITWPHFFSVGFERAFVSVFEMENWKSTCISCAFLVILLLNCFPFFLSCARSLCCWNAIEHE